MSRGRSFRQGGGSRSRRMIAIQQANESPPENAPAPQKKKRPRPQTRANATPEAAGDHGTSETDESPAEINQPVLRVFEASQRETPAMREVKRFLDGSRPVTWVFTGDGITHGAGHTDGHRSYSEHFTERVRWELKRFLDVVVNTGVSGDRALSLSKNLEWRVLRFRPEVVSLMLGLTDSVDGADGRQRFRDHLAAIVDRLRSEGSAVVLNTPNRINLLKARRHLDLPAYVQIVRNVAAEFETPIIDHWAHWEEVKSSLEGMPGWLANDGVHPDAAGHAELARLFFAEVGIFDPKSPTCRDAGG